MNKTIHVCGCCNGTGEMIVEPGGDGYPPLYDECIKCNGDGYQESVYIEDYDGDHIFQVVQLG